MNVNTKSGPHPSLQSESGEVREVQFEVQRLCPHVTPNDESEWEFMAFAVTKLPYAVWVEWPGRTCPAAMDGCGEEEYRLTGASKVEFEKHFLADRTSPFTSRWVCKHMGRLIE